MTHGIWRAKASLRAAEACHYSGYDNIHSSSLSPALSISLLSAAFHMVQRSTEKCKPITTLEQCEAAADELGLAVTKAKYDRGNGKKSGAPPNCYYASKKLPNKLMFNADSGNDGACSEDYQCLCHAGMSSHSDMLL